MGTVPESTPALNITESKTDADIEKAFTDPKQTEKVQVTDDGDGNLVDFDGSDDPSNPQNWSSKYKWGITIVISLITLTNNFAIVMCAPAAPQILADFAIPNSYFYSTLLVSIWELGQMVGPTVIAPLSELYGKVRVYNTANVCFIICSLGSALSVNASMLTAFRFLNGMTVASISLNSSIVGDLFVKEERGRAIAIMALSPKIGPIAGPIIGGYLSDAKGWRWTFWLITILAGAFSTLFLLTYRETYKVKILADKAKRLRRETGNPHLKSRYASDLTRAQRVQNAVVRPFRMLCYSPTIFLLSLYRAIIYGYTYLILTTLTPVFEMNYGFSASSAGLTFIGLGVGLVAGNFFCGLALDRLVQKKKSRGDMKPEDRLLPVVVGGVAIPIALFVYGWTIEARIHWIVPILATTFLGFGVSATTMPAQTYVVDAYGIYAASAVAAVAVLRCCSGAFLPLAGPAMYARFGIGWGNSFLGFIALALVPAPLLLMRFGERMRKKEQIEVLF